MGLAVYSPGEIAQGDPFPAAERDGMLQGGPQLAHIAGPIVALQRLLSLGGESGELLLVLPGKLLEKGVG